MTEPLLSIIVPVYNAQKYLEECLKSIRSQGFESYEVLMINDGSTDYSARICEEFAESDKRFHLFSTENKGVSHARNLGIEKAKAPWLMFLDSDDYLMKDSLNALVQCIDEKTEEVCGNFCMHEDAEFSGGRAPVNASDVITMILDPANNSCLPKFYHLESATLLGVWGKLFRRDIVMKNELRFDEKLKLSEDMLFHIQYLKCIQTVCLYDEPVFYYRQHTGSVTRNFKTEHFQNRLYLFEQLEKMQMLDEVFLISTMLQLQGQLLIGAKKAERKDYCRQFRVFWQNRKGTLEAAKDRKISVGKWQNQVYHICIELLLRKLYVAEEIFLHSYVKITEGRKNHRI